MEVGLIGLGKMGLNIALNLSEKGHQVKGSDASIEVRQKAADEKIAVYEDLAELVASFSDKRIIWLMLPAGKITQQVLTELMTLLQPGDIVIDGGNSNYKDSVARFAACKEKGIHFLDCGTSGGISGARNEACLMIGGEEEIFTSIEVLFADLAIENGYLCCGKPGSGHFLKMVHNGIEYGMMQAIGEGFQVVEASQYDYDLADVAKVWNHGSVIRGWLMELAEEQFNASPHLEEYKGVAQASGEAKWTVEAALDLEVPVPTIALSLFMRNLSNEEDSFSMKVVSALRNGFGGHAVVKKE